MAKKIRFPLKLADNAQVRTLDELREHFDLEAIVGYYKNGKLLTWLEDRYLEGEAEGVRALDEAAPDFQEKLCGLFQVEYTGNTVDLEAVARRQERLAKLRTVTDEQEFIDHIDQVAFDQEDLADLLDEGTNTIYLCGEKFIIPASRKGICYVGINHPTVHISGVIPKRREDLGIEFRAVDCDNLPNPAVEAEVDHVELESGNKGYRIPQVYFKKPVYLDGVKYDHVPVLSVDIFTKMELRVGSVVEVYRVGDVIPAIRKVTTGDGPALELPAKCPTCGCNLKVVNGKLKCTNLKCADNIVGKLKNCVKLLGIVGYDDTLGKLGELVRRKGEGFPVAAFINLSAAELEAAGVSGRLHDDLHNAITSVQDHIMLAALGIPTIGPATAKKLLKLYGSWFNMRFALSEHIMDYKDVLKPDDKILPALSKADLRMLEDEMVRLMPRSMGCCPRSNAYPLDIGFHPMENYTCDEKTKIGHTGGRLSATVIKLCMENDFEVVDDKSFDILITHDHLSTSGKMKRAIEDHLPIFTEEDFIEIYSD